jgi:hypothetical protein
LPWTFNGLDIPCILPGYRESRLKKAFNTRIWNGTAYRSLEYKKKTDDRAQVLAVVSWLADEGKYPALTWRNTCWKRYSKWVTPITVFSG